MWGSQGGRAAAAAAAVLVGTTGAVVLRQGTSGPPDPPEGTRVASSAPRTTRAQAPRAPDSHATPTHRRTEPTSSPDRPAGVADAVHGPVLPSSPPVRVTVARLHLSSRLVRLGLDADGAMQVPADPAVPGWYDRGPTPGSLGPAVIAGHVTWNRVPAVFFRLATLRRGDRVGVLRADSTKAVFVVEKVARFPKVRFPTRAVFGPTDRAALRLVTCGGTYDVATHRYRDNVVVFADLVATHRVTGR